MPLFLKFSGLFDWWSVCCTVTPAPADEWVPLSFRRCSWHLTPLLLIWRIGSCVELPGWKGSQNVACGSSSADAAQSRSWRRCTWHKTRWLYLGSGALRQREETEGWRSVAICFPRAHFGFCCGDYCYFLEWWGAYFREMFPLREVASLKAINI